MPEASSSVAASCVFFRFSVLRHLSSLSNVACAFGSVHIDSVSQGKHNRVVGLVGRWHGWSVGQGRCVFGSVGLWVDGLVASVGGPFGRSIIFVG